MKDLEGVNEILVDFALPALVFIITGVLLFCGRDSDVKTVFALAAGWLFKSGYTRRKKTTTNK